MLEAAALSAQINLKFLKIPNCTKLSKTNEIICSGIDKELDFVKSNLEQTINATNILKKHINNTFHASKRGVNVITNMTNRRI